MKITPKRYLALDVLRGMTVAFMIIVNTPGSWSEIYAPLEHAAWHGCTPTDVVFPSFLFVVGNALSFSIHKLELLPAKQFFKKSIYRGFIIFAIGWLLNAFSFVNFTGGHYEWKDMTGIRLWGVLQRIGVCYTLAAILVYYFNRRWLMIISGVLLAGYWLILYSFGDYTLPGNAVLKIDLLYLTPKNMYRHYDIPFEPLGLLSTLPSVVNVLIGYLCGSYLQQSDRLAAIKGLSGIGAIMILIGMGWNVIFPFNKALWTSSYVLYTSGIDMVLLAGLIWLLDIWQLKKWSYFFEVFGKNPLFIYILSWVVAVLIGIIHIDGPSLKGIIYKNAFTNWLSPKNASLAFAVVFMLMMWVVGWVMDRRRVYVKV